MDKYKTKESNDDAKIYKSRNAVTLQAMLAAASRKYRTKQTSPSFSRFNEANDRRGAVGTNAGRAADLGSSPPASGKLQTSVSTGALQRRLGCLWHAWSGPA